MKLEVRIEGKILVIEAEGAVSVTVSDDSPAIVQKNDGLFAKLSNLRKELAKSANVPPYVIFNDKTLHEMAEKCPSDLAEMGAISGVGQTKLEKYGEQFLAVINNMRDSIPIT